MIDSISQYTHEHTWQGILLLIVLVAILAFISKIDKAITTLIRWNRGDAHRDCHRVYTPKQKKMASHLCMDRCEGIGILSRCVYRGDRLQGDHWYPYSRGGATTLRNLVMLCPKCNRRKTDKIPSRFQTWALRIRRKIGTNYRPGIPTRVGEWLPYSYRSDGRKSFPYFF